jgi:hypothetical protein
MTTLEIFNQAPMLALALGIVALAIAGGFLLDLLVLGFAALSALRGAGSS